MCRVKPNKKQNIPFEVVLSKDHISKFYLSNRKKVVEINRQARVSADMTLFQTNLPKNILL